MSLFLSDYLYENIYSHSSLQVDKVGSVSTILFVTVSTITLLILAKNGHKKSYFVTVLRQSFDTVTALYLLNHLKESESVCGEGVGEFAGVA